MNSKTRFRRDRVSVVRIASQYRELTDPLYNLREIVKQMILLEDHLSHPNKRCPDCIQKHLLTIEGLAEEAMGLDQSGITTRLDNYLATVARHWLQEFLDQKDPHVLANEVRQIRKNLSPNVCDPRKNASLQLSQSHCNHLIG